MIEPFTIRVPDEVLADLRQRLQRSRFPDQLEGAGWDYGTELQTLRELCRYWRDDYDWRVAEQTLNAFDNFTTEVDGLRLHFIHQRSAEADALPLVITHGWPGSVYEFKKIIGPLTDPVAHGGHASGAFHGVCPSMPGYGFSDPPRSPGFDVRQVAQTVSALMAQLGYQRYAAQGGDWGALVTAWLGQLDAEHVCGIHMNMVVARPPRNDDPDRLTAEESERAKRISTFMKQETGYQAIQGTKPQTLGYGLMDSPVGLAAWILEKLRTWSDCGGNVERRFTKDELLTFITIYWVTGSITSSMRLYCESMRAGTFAPVSERIEVPTACALFPGEIVRPPRAWAEQHYNITHWTEMPRGGHFAAFEEPELLVEDIREFFRGLR